MTPKLRLHSWITANVKGDHPSPADLPSVVTYARTIRLFTATYYPFNPVVTDDQLLAHLTSPDLRLRPPFFRNTQNLITDQAVTPEDFRTQRHQHSQFLRNLPADTTQTFVLVDGILTETEPHTLIPTKNGVVAKHFDRTVTNSAHAVAIPDHTLYSPHGPAIGIPSAIFKQLRLHEDQPIMFLRNPVIHRDGIHFAYPVRTPHTHALSIHPYFCEPLNLDFDGDQINIYKIEHTVNLAKVTELITQRYPNPLPIPTNKDFALVDANFTQSLSLQDYMYNTATYQEFLRIRPSKKCNDELRTSAQHLLRSRNEQEYHDLILADTAYRGLFQSKADIGKIGGLYKKLVFAFPNRILEIMEMMAPLQQQMLDQKHSRSTFSVDDLTRSFNLLHKHTDNLDLLLTNIPPQHHKLLRELRTELRKADMPTRHAANMPYFTYLATTFGKDIPPPYTMPAQDNLFHFLTSLTNPTKQTLPTKLPELPELTDEEADEFTARYLASLWEQRDIIPQQYYDHKSDLIKDHPFKITVVANHSKLAEYKTRNAVSFSKIPEKDYLYAPNGCCPLHRSESDPSFTPGAKNDPLSFMPNFNGHLTSAVPLMIPYLHQTGPARGVYACNNITNALPLRYPEQPLCRTKLHTSFQAGVNLRTTFLASPYTYEDAVIISETASVKLTTLDGSPAKPGDKITGRHGNKAVISVVLPDNEMPDNAEIVFSPMSVTSRKNFGFLAEIQSNILHENKPHTEVPIEHLLAQKSPTLNTPTGRLTGSCYILRNDHTAESGMKVHTSPTSFSQYRMPTSGESISLNHVYALEVLGLRSLIAEFYSFRSNEDQIVSHTKDLYKEPQSLQVIRTLYRRLTSPA